MFYLWGTKPIKMKILKYLLYILLALVVIGVILGLVGPKSYRVERSAVIAATPDVVWPYTSSLKKYQEWSPWAKKDTNMVLEYTGTDGTVGSGLKWEGNKDVDKGEQTLTSLVPGKSSETQLKFYMPWGVGESTSYMNLEPVPEGTKMTWGIKGDNDFIGKIFDSLMNMDKAMGKDFEEGLANLQAVVASGPKEAKMDYQVNPGQYPVGKYLAVHKTLPMSEISSFYAKNVPAIMTEIQKAKVEVTGPPSGIYYTWDEEKGVTDMAAAVGILGILKAPAGMEVIIVPASKSLTIEYKGGYGKMVDAHMAMDSHRKNNKLEFLAPVIEEYMTGPGTEPDSNKWVTKIIYLIK